VARKLYGHKEVLMEADNEAPRVRSSGFWTLHVALISPRRASDPRASVKHGRPRAGPAGNDQALSGPPLNPTPHPPDFIIGCRVDLPPRLSPPTVV
jgi:hypothetical protein